MNLIKLVLILVFIGNLLIAGCLYLDFDYNVNIVLAGIFVQVALIWANLPINGDE